MNKIICVSLILLFANLANAMTETDSLEQCQIYYDTLTKKEVHKIPEKMPTVEGGLSSLYKMISKEVKVKTPLNLLDSKVIVCFIVDKNGEVAGERVIKDISGDNVGDQILRLIEKAIWNSGYCNGEKVDVLMILPISFHFG